MIYIDFSEGKYVIQKWMNDRGTMGYPYFRKPPKKLRILDLYMVYFLRAGQVRIC